MRAILSGYYPNGTPKLVGSENRIITKEYKTFATLYRYAIKSALKQWDGRVHVEIWYNWDNRYEDADKIMTFNDNIFVTEIKMIKGEFPEDLLGKNMPDFSYYGTL